MRTEELGGKVILFGTPAEESKDCVGGSGNIS